MLLLEPLIWQLMIVTVPAALFEMPSAGDGEAAIELFWMSGEDPE
jgi:hypothetical protein